jgi:hypothetical protein
MSQGFWRERWTGGLRVRDASGPARGWRKNTTKKTKTIALREA